MKIEIEVDEKTLGLVEEQKKLGEFIAQCLLEMIPCNRTIFPSIQR